MEKLYRLAYIGLGAGLVLASQQPFAGDAVDVLYALGLLTAGAAFPDRVLPGLKK
ncbi:MAG: hypothetical protein VW405_08735 [Rhodospirillaceae bacterium]